MSYTNSDETMSQLYLDRVNGKTHTYVFNGTLFKKTTGPFSVTQRYKVYDPADEAFLKLTVEFCEASGEEVFELNTVYPDDVEYAFREGWKQGVEYENTTVQDGK